MKHYRINKLARPDGLVVKRKDILATGDKEAMKRAEEDDCPFCEVYHEGKKVGAIL